MLKASVLEWVAIAFSKTVDSRCETTATDSSHETYPTSASRVMSVGQEIKISCITEHVRVAEIMMMVTGTVTTNLCQVFPMCQTGC